ncbi:mitogen activated protein kinase kinase kinase 3, Mapkkk3, Mekk3 [Aspergillus luchuensis]|uniref:Mitogen activated protein kinase kinase kinase 3, Mapkkk3, Mekk3 n=1 Tax=Aspergillus kawachii TaxID=1069201 RepID=A0A146FQR8_ASPKA|nr:mitogen activated protein kinase kinase kinase 3, Mapkkk3, Mekk3 [Aspergillus luchuensis]
MELSRRSRGRRQPCISSLELELAWQPGQTRSGTRPAPGTFDDAVELVTPSAINTMLVALQTNYHGSAGTGWLS